MRLHTDKTLKIFYWIEPSKVRITTEIKIKLLGGPEDKPPGNGSFQVLEYILSLFLVWRLGAVSELGTLMDCKDNIRTNIPTYQLQKHKYISFVAWGKVPLCRYQMEYTTIPVSWLQIVLKYPLSHKLTATKIARKTHISYPIWIRITCAFWGKLKFYSAYWRIFLR